MKKQDQIIFIESDEISLFLAESLLEAINFKGLSHFFTNMEEVLEFINALNSSRSGSVSLFISTKMLVGERELIQQLRDLLFHFPSKICLLSSMEGFSGEEKGDLQQMGISCTIEKPLTEAKLLHALQETDIVPAQVKK
ncbi:hypothetical protein [Nafulsella turpanensis]|uniref:hypothetical protein n=1 Tax=Nafulsella turpanensis TaxID=1265690 RepID=UPI0012678AAF|nr:hypothetical protein [Nafulsella turpanensis]